MSTSASETTAESVGAPRTIPRPTSESRYFWDACARHELVIQRCTSCGRCWFPPSNHCQYCWSEDFAWTPVSGRGELYTFTVFRRAYASELVEQIPYVVGVVELEEGPRLITNITECETAHVRVGMPVEVVFNDIAEGFTLHAFRPREDPQSPGTGAV
ncbi:MAG: nucleic acid-binding protein [Propionibacteriales bacterium]|nr:nucleic acid-binding protein [Propionibacteriales bacterium]